MGRPRWTKEQVLEAIKGSMGIVSAIAARLDKCGWCTAQRYIERWQETREAYADECERSLDMSESQLLKAIQSGDGPMIRFHLATKGKRRGYTERTELTGADGGPVVIELSELSDDELERIARGEAVAAGAGKRRDRAAQA